MHGVCGSAGINEAVLSSKRLRQIGSYAMLCTCAWYLHMQCDLYFPKVASSQGIMRSLFVVKQFETKVSIINELLWKRSHKIYVAKCAWKYQKVSVKDVSSSWNTLINYNLLASWNDYLLTFMPNNAYTKKRLL